MELFEQVPQAFDVVVFVGYIGVIKVYPIANLFGEIVPTVFEHEYIGSTLFVVIFHGDFGADVFFFDAQALFYLQFDGQAVGIPAAFSGYAEPLLCFVPTENILDGAGHHVVDAGHAVGARRSFKKGKTRRIVALVNALLEHRFLLPKSEDFRFDLRPIQLFECRIHSWVISKNTNLLNSIGK